MKYSKITYFFKYFQCSDAMSFYQALAEMLNNNIYKTPNVEKLENKFTDSSWYFLPV